MEDQKNINETIYSQDCEFYRYQDQLKWSRFQTAAVVEGAVFTGIYKLQLLSHELRIFMITGFFLVLILLLLSWKDMLNAESHIDRIRTYENNYMKLYSKKLWGIIKGKHLMIVAILVINILNIITLKIKW